MVQRERLHRMSALRDSPECSEESLGTESTLLEDGSILGGEEETCGLRMDSGILCFSINVVFREKRADATHCVRVG